MEDGDSFLGRGIRHPYCLSCYAVMEPFPGSSRPCERCGFVNVKRDQRLFWTQEPRLVELEEWAKTLIVYLLIGIGILLLVGFGGRPSFGTGQGWAIAFPILVGVLLWETASKITRIKPYFRATIAWRILLAVPAPVLLLAAHDFQGGSRALLIASGTLALLGALLGGRLGRALGRWRDRRILAGQEAGSSPHS